LKDHEGWRALGYRNWTECTEREFGVKARNVFYELEAGEIERELLQNDAVGTIPARQLHPLAALPTPDLRREAWQQANTGPDRVTAKKVEEAVNKVGIEPLIEKLPEEERPVVVRMTTQPGIPLPLAQKMAQKMAEAEPEQRREVIDLYRSDDVRDRNKAMTWAADRVTPADPRLVTYRECIRELRRTVREFPEDQEVSLISRAVELIEEAIASIKKGADSEVMNGTTHD